MKQLSFYLATTAIGLLMCSCGNSTASTDDIVEYYPVKIDNADNWGMLGPDGKLLFEDEFKNMPSCVVDGVFAVEENDGISLYEASAKPKLIKDCEGLKAAGYMSEGLIPVVKEHSRIYFVDKSGETKFTLEPINGKEIASCDIAFYDGMIKIKNEEGEYGYANTKGKVVIQPKYVEGSVFSEGYAVVKRMKNDNPKWVIIDKNGKELVTLKNNLNIGIGNYFKDGEIIAYNDDNRYGFLNTKGEFSKCPSKVKGITEYNKELYIFNDEDYKYGVRERGEDGEVLIRAKYDWITMISDDKFLAQDDDEFFFLNKKGDKEKVFDDYDRVWKLNGKGFDFVVRDGSNFIFTDANGKPINKDEYANASDALAVNYSIESDYFDAGGMAKKIASMVNADGIGKYKINAVASSYLSDAQRYCYDYYFTPDEEIEGGYRYTLSMRIGTTQAIARSEYNYDPYTYSGSYSYNFNPDSKLETIALKGSAETKCWKEVSEALVKELKGKGYKLMEDSGNEIVLESNMCKLTLSASDREKTVNVLASLATPEEPAVAEVAEAEAAY